MTRILKPPMQRSGVIRRHWLTIYVVVIALAVILIVALQAAGSAAR